MNGPAAAFAFNLQLGLPRQSRQIWQLPHLESCAHSRGVSTRSLYEQVTQLKEESGLVPGDAVRLVRAIPSALCTDEAAANVLEVATLLRSHGVPDFALSAAVKHCPDLFAVQVNPNPSKSSVPPCARQ